MNNILNASATKRMAIIEGAAIAVQPPAASERHATLRYERGTPGKENDMPSVVSCNWLPDGDHAVYLAAPLPPAASQPSEPVKRWCETCEGGGYVFQEPQFGCHVWGNHPCPDCDGKGYWVASQPPAAIQPKGDK